MNSCAPHSPNALVVMSTFQIPSKPEERNVAVTGRVELDGIKHAKRSKYISATRQLRAWIPEAVGRKGVTNHKLGMFCPPLGRITPKSIFYMKLRHDVPKTKIDLAVVNGGYGYL
jgi:hypothetical protein